MAVNKQKLLELLMVEVSSIAERYTGYHDDLVDCLADVIALESGHLQQATSIRKKVQDKCDLLGNEIAKRVAKDEK